MAIVVIFVAIGVSTFSQPYGPTRNLIDMVDASVVALLTLALLIGVQRLPSRPILRRMLPFALAASAVTCGWAALTQSGAPFVVLAAMTTCAAAYNFGLPNRLRCHRRRCNRRVGAQRLDGPAGLDQTFGGRSLGSGEQFDGPFDVALVGEQRSCRLDLDAE